MQACKVTIATTVDNKTTEIVRDGKMSLSAACVKIYYLEENAAVTVSFENGVVCIDRQGDYTMRLCLKKGEICDGVLGIGGAEGSVQTQTNRIAYSLKDDSFMILLHYDLLIGGETQKMRIRLFAK